MLVIILEITRIILMGLLLVFLLYQDKKTLLSHQEGWRFIILGFALLFFGSLIDITDEFPGLAKFIIIGPTSTQAILEKIVGYTFGSVFLFVGFLRWIPIISKSFEMDESLQKAHDELERRVEERTKELTQANTRLKQAERVQYLFLANMSHELRTPLNSIIGFTGMILMGVVGDINDEQKKQLTIVKNSGHHLLSLINDILDISRVESGKLDIYPDEFGIDEVIQEVVDKVTPLVNEKKVELIGDVSNKTTINSSRKHVKRILINLVSNAVKFTDRGSVKIKSKVLKNEHLEVCVIDTGIGIKKEDISKLFRFFQQVDMSSAKKYAGTGMGLYLSKKLVNLLGGDIAVKSEYGKGSEFSLILPIKFRENQINKTSEKIF